MYFSAAFIAAALPFLVEALPVPTPRGLPIPLSKRDAARRADGTVDLVALRASIRSSVAKVHRGFAAYERNMGTAHPLAAYISASSSAQKRQTGSGADALTDDSQVLWYGTIEVGTPPKQFTVDFDTGSSDLFLPGLSCNSSCAGHTAYNPSASSSSADVGQTFSLAYGDGSTVSGEQFVDAVSLSGLTATNQTLGAASQYSSGFMQPNFPADGLLGMAFPSISVYGASPLFQSLIATKAVTEPVFGFHLAQTGAELFVGGTNAALFTGDFTYVNVTREGYWQVPLDGVTLGGHSVLPVAGPISAIVDTGTTLIVGDTQTVQGVYEAIAGAVDNGDGTWSVPCDATPQLALTFGGKSFSVSPKAFVLGAGSSSTSCIGGLSYDDAIAGQFWIVGDVFLQNVYTAFDVGASRVGFASLANGTDASGAPSGSALPADPAPTASASASALPAATASASGAPIPGPSITRTVVASILSTLAASSALPASTAPACPCAQSSPTTEPSASASEALPCAQSSMPSSGSGLEARHGSFAEE